MGGLREEMEWGAVRCSAVREAGVRSCVRACVRCVGRFGFNLAAERAARAAGGWVWVGIAYLVQ